MPHDFRDYDRQVDDNRKRAADLLTRHADAYSKTVDPRLGLIARGLDTACRADPNALAGLDCWAAAQLILERFF